MLFKMLRWQNLLFVGVIQVLIYFRLQWDSQIHDIPLLGSTLILILIVVTTMLATGSGYVINDIIDVDVDKINRPERPIPSGKISVNKAYQLYAFLTLTGLIGSIALGLMMKSVIYPAFFLFSAYLMFFYSKRWKASYFIGNLVVGILCAASILVVIAPELGNGFLLNFGKHTLTLIFLLAWFGFITTVYREIVKDIEDVEGDRKMNHRTIPIISGRRFAKRIAFSFGCIILISLGGFVVAYFQVLSKTAIVMDLLLIMAFIYCQFCLVKANSSKEMHRVSQLIKIFMLFGIIAILLN